MPDEGVQCGHMRILLVEDTETLAKYVKQALEEDGYSTDVSGDGVAGERMARAFPYDLVILDVMLPGRNGIDVCKRLRADDVNVPVILVTAKGDVEDRVLGLDSGADDYLVKPFDVKELLARVRALLRRPSETLADALRSGDLVLDRGSHSVTQRGRSVSLTLKEYSVLEYLMRNAGRVVTREQLLEHCWDFSFSSMSNITDVYIRQLRKKLADRHETYIQTIRGVGYRFVES